MKMGKCLAAVSGLAMLAGTALGRPDVDADELLGAWDATIAGPEGEATVRVVFAEDGTYLALAMVGGMEDAVPFWETGEWEVDGDELTFTATASSEADGEEVTTLTIEDVDGDTLDVSSEDGPMWNELDFKRPEAELVGVWQAEVEEGTAIFAMCDCGGFAGSLGDGGEHTEAFWGTWESDGEEITFSASDAAWTPEGAEEVEDHSGTIEGVSDDTLTLLMEDLSEEAIEWERQEAHPLVGEWVGEPHGDDITVTFNDDHTFTVEMEGEDGKHFGGIWTVAASGVVFLGVTDGEMESMAMHFVMTSPGAIMLGETLADLEVFEKQ